MYIHVGEAVSQVVLLMDFFSFFFLSSPLHHDLFPININYTSRFLYFLPLFYTHISCCTLHGFGPHIHSALLTLMYCILVRPIILVHDICLTKYP